MAKFSLDKTASYLLPVAEISAVFISRTYANWRVFFMTNTPFPLPKKEKISRRKKKKKKPTFETRMWPLIIRTCLRICGWTAEGGIPCVKRFDAVCSVADSVEKVNSAVNFRRPRRVPVFQRHSAPSRRQRRGEKVAHHTHVRQGRGRERRKGLHETRFRSIPAQESCKYL